MFQLSSDVELASQQQVQEIVKHIQELTNEIKKISKLGDNEILTNKEVCKMLRISTRSLQNLRDEQRVPFIQFKAGGVVHYRKSDIMEFIENNIVPVQK